MGGSYGRNVELMVEIMSNLNKMLPSKPIVVVMEVVMVIKIDDMH